jgi:hypothetical protein
MAAMVVIEAPGSERRMIHPIPAMQAIDCKDAAGETSLPTIVSEINVKVHYDWDELAAIGAHTIRAHARGTVTESVTKTVIYRFEADVGICFLRTLPSVPRNIFLAAVSVSSVTRIVWPFIWSALRVWALFYTKKDEDVSSDDYLLIWSTFMRCREFRSSRSGYITVPYFTNFTAFKVIVKFAMKHPEYGELDFGARPGNDWIRLALRTQNPAIIAWITKRCSCDSIGNPMAAGHPEPHKYPLDTDTSVSLLSEALFVCLVSLPAHANVAMASLSALLDGVFQDRGEGYEVTQADRDTLESETDLQHIYRQLGTFEGDMHCPDNVECYQGLLDRLRLQTCSKRSKSLKKILDDVGQRRKTYLRELNPVLLTSTPLPEALIPIVRACLVSV